MFIFSLSTLLLVMYLCTDIEKQHYECSSKKSKIELLYDPEFYSYVFMYNKPIIIKLLLNLHVHCNTTYNNFEMGRN